MPSKQKSINSGAEKELSVSLHENVGWITLNRPEVRNAISKAMWDAIPPALRQLKDEGAKVIVFRGEGKTFAAGADLAELSQLSGVEQASEHWCSIRSALNMVASFELPAIAMIEGPCMGGGCLLALACDIRVADINAIFSVPTAQLGIQLDHDNIARLINVVGRGFASEMLFTGATLKAGRAVEIGLINSAVAAGELQSTVAGIAEQVKRNSSASIQATKSAIAQICQRGRVEDDQTLVVASYLSEDTQQRVARALSRKV